ncbi:LPS export ABC transporter periplasmic protein LptC [Stenotrophomonas sp. Sa5BUN4]|uniref:LPS export ABC transporter periplasmic protein LptC n=1 Tax=Stenotrophomonas lacuserhaii TaxID=2760084 RepID=A0A8X8K2D5_9GAMM|nr:LPS export ABC transporter periplasmic protein LptC [Stenotrophomonas pennii]MBD7953860.1 LPS export ABC transporter periplasmic protein LptC [Stenotrophomonas pennii]
MNWRTAIGATLLVVAILSGWSLLRNRDKGPQAIVDDGSVDYVLHDFQIVMLDDEGKESTTLRAPRLERLRADQTLTIATPVFEMPGQDGNHWTMRSETGWVSAKGDEMRLRGNVAGDSPTVGNTPPTTFRTTHLNVFPKENRARTDALVTMTRPGMEQSGVGFELDSNNNTYHFLSQSKGRYLPRR